MSIRSTRSAPDPEALGTGSDDLTQPPESQDQKAGELWARQDALDTVTLTPVWFQYIVLLGCAGVLSFGGFGLLLAVAGHFSGFLAILLGLMGTVLCTVLARPTRKGGPSQKAAARVTVPAAGACIVAFSVAIWNSIDIGHNVAVLSDPGVYLTAGRWLASHPSLVVPANAPWAGTDISTNVASGGMYLAPHGTLQFQFAHLLPVLLAEAHHLGGDGLMFRVPAVTGALGLCAIYAVGCRLVRRPWLVLAAVTALAISMPQLNVSRDTFSETATQVLLWGGIWLLLRSYEERRPGVALVAGLALGGTLMTRIDAVAYLLPLPLLAAVAWLATRSPDDRKSLFRVYTALVAGVLPTAILGTIDVQRLASPYYHALVHQMHHLYLLLGLFTVLAVAVLFTRAFWSRPVTWFTRRRKQISVAAAGVIGIGLILAWSVRPLGPTSMLTGPFAAAVAGVQQSEHLPIHPETFAEHTVQWFSWYLGPITMVLAIAGLCFMTVQALRRGGPVLVVLAMAAPLTAIYLWNPNITPVQIWATRRYVPASLPLFIFAASFAVDGLASATWRLLRDRAWSRLVAIAGAVSMIVFPLSTVWPVRNFSVQANYLPLVDHTCRVIGPDAAVLFPANDWDESILGQTLRSWCNVPVATLPGPIQGTQLAAIDSSVETQGKTLWVLSADASPISQISRTLTPELIGTAKSPRELEVTVDRPPSAYTPMTLSIYGAKVP